MRVFAYWNLHKACWSLKAMEGPYKGVVVAHCTAFHLSECSFKVSEAGRQRVIREQRKHVHAGVVGSLQGFVPLKGGTNKLADGYKKQHTCECNECTKITYNPYVSRYFETISSPRVAIQEASLVAACNKQIAICKYT